MSSPSPLVLGCGFGCGAISTTPFPGDPLTDVIRTISEFDPVGFAGRQKYDSVAVHESDLREIDDDLALFAFEQFTQHGHILTADPTTHPHNNSVLLADTSFDSEAHFDGVVPSPFPVLVTVPATSCGDRRTLLLQNSAHSEVVGNTSRLKRQDVFNLPRFRKFGGFGNFRRRSLAEFELALMDVQGFDPGIKSSWRDSKLGGSTGRPGNSASALGQGGLDHFPFAHWLVLKGGE